MDAIHISNAVGNLKKKNKIVCNQIQNHNINLNPLLPINGNGSGNGSIEIHTNAHKQCILFEFYGKHNGIYLMVNVILCGQFSIEDL